MDARLRGHDSHYFEAKLDAYEIHTVISRTRPQVAPELKPPINGVLTRPSVGRTVGAPLCCCLGWG